MTTRTRPTIDLDGTTYTARPYTNGLRAKLADELEKRRGWRSRATRLNLVIQTLQQNATAGDTVPDDIADKIGEAFDEIDALQRELEDSSVELAPRLLVNEDGKAPTKSLIDEHAELEELSTLVGVALREIEPEDAEPSPTPAEPATS